MIVQTYSVFLMLSHCGMVPEADTRPDISENELVGIRICRNLPSAKIDLFDDEESRDVSYWRFFPSAQFAYGRGETSG